LARPSNSSFTSFIGRGPKGLFEFAIVITSSGLDRATTESVIEAKASSQRQAALKLKPLRIDSAPASVALMFSWRWIVIIKRR
jgi:hypothetical protein